MSTSIPDLDPKLERQLAAGLYNDAWRLLDLAERTPAQDDELIHCAHASRYHWGRAGEGVNLARGEWLCSRVYAVLRRPEPAMWHARRCLAILEGLPASGPGAPEAWDRSGAYEAMARASSVAGDRAEASRWLALARESLAKVSDAEDRDPIEQDLATIPI
jgi:hypothetical protein